ncbi:MAG TPA: DUF3293 domain-containing protein [Fodinibius sp.]|nr:DUF3293 domain-containing protein [Fodinibius sp.]
MANKVEAQLVQAYKETTYQVEDPHVEIRIDRYHPKLDQLLDKYDNKEWLFITVWNPGSQERASDENKLRNKRLETEFKDKVYFQGSGVPDDNSWTPEESFLVLGYDKNEARQLAKKYGQNAVVFGRFKDKAELILL